MNDDDRIKFLEAGKKLLETRRQANLIDSPVGKVKPSERLNLSVPLSPNSNLTSPITNGKSVPVSPIYHEENLDDIGLIKSRVLNKRVEQLQSEKGDLLTQLELTEKNLKEVCIQNTTLRNQLKDTEDKVQDIRAKLTQSEEKLKNTENKSAISGSKSEIERIKAQLVVETEQHQLYKKNS